jgi:hypothetical protein
VGIRIVGGAGRDARRREPARDDSMSRGRTATKKGAR